MVRSFSMKIASEQPDNMLAQRTREVVKRDDEYREANHQRKIDCVRWLDFGEDSAV